MAGGLLGTSAQAQANLQISSFTYNTPVLNGSTNAFTVVAKNGGDASASNARLRVFLPANFTFSAAPAGCAIENSPHSFNATNNPDPATAYTAPAYSSLRMLYCDYANVAPSPAGDISLTFAGVASSSATPEVADMAADFYSDTVEPLAGAGANNFSQKSITVNSGADLALLSPAIYIFKGATQLIPTGIASTTSGSALTVNVKTKNNGPDPASTASVQIDLPTSSNFGSVVVPTGSPWACSNASSSVTCSYTGGAVLVGSNFPDIAITGSVANVLTGSIDFSASMPLGLTDPVASNNAAQTVTLSIKAVADLSVSKSLLAYGLSSTRVAFGKPAVYRVVLSNNGPNAVPSTLASAVDTLGAGWVIGSLPAACSLSGSTVTCSNTATLNSGASLSFDIPVTAPPSGTCPANTVTTQLSATMADTTTGNDSQTVACSWVPATADIAASKRLLIGGSDVTLVALGQSAVFRIGISNAALQPVVPANGAQVVDTFDAAWTLGAMPSGCNKVGQVVSCTNPSAMAAGGPAVTFDIPVTAPSSGSGATNTATVSLLGASGLTDGNASNDTASVTYGFGIPQVDVSATKDFLLNGNSVSAVGLGQAVVFRIGIANSAASPLPVPIGGANVVDTIATGWTIGALPLGCSAIGQQVTCVNQAAINPGTSRYFDIPVTSPNSPDSCNGGSNSATVTLTDASMVDPTLGAANTTSVACAAVTSNADIYVYAKTKVRTVAAGILLGNGEQITNTIKVKNRSSSNAFATGTITVTDTLGPNEVFVSGGGAGVAGDGVWSSCTSSVALGAVNGVVTCTILTPAAGLAPDAALADLTIITKADLSAGTADPVTGLFTLTNSACAGRAADALYTLDSTGNDCFSKSITASRVTATVALVKTATTADSDTTLNGNEDTITYTVAATASGFSGGTTIPTLVISDTIPNTLYGTWGSVSPSTTGVTAAVGGAGSGEGCSVSHAVVTCTLKNLVDSVSRSITITLTRPVFSGAGKLNTATATSPDSFITGTLSANATVTVEPRTEISATKSANPATVRTGVDVAFTVTVNLDGPDGAANLRMLDAFDATKFDYVVGSAKIGGVPVSCAVQTMNAATGDAEFDGVTGLQCDLGTINPDIVGTRKTFSVVYHASPKYPYPGSAFPTNATYTNKVRLKTDTFESNTANNKATVDVSIQPPVLDLSVTNRDVTDPVEWDDSASPNAQIVYLVKAISSNTSQSTAHNVRMIDVPVPPAGFNMTFAGYGVNVSSPYVPTAGVTCTADNGGATPSSYVICSFADLPTGQQVWLNMTFNLGQTAGSPARAVSFNNVAKICSDEAGPTAASQAVAPADPAGSLCSFSAANYDATPADNRTTEPTTVLPLTDLHAFYKKPVAFGTTTEITSIQLNEEFDYLIKVRDKGPVSSFLATVTDALPHGFRRTATAITVTPGSAVGATNGNSCSSVIAANVETVTCNIGPLPADSNADGAEDATKAWVIRIPVKADPVAFTTAPAQLYNTNIANTVTIIPAQDPLDPTRPLSKDKVPGNNSATGNILVPVKAKISGRVFEGLSLTAAPTGAETGINGFVITLTGLDDAGAFCVAPGVSVNLACGLTRTATTATLSGVVGSYLFDDLPPGRYTVEETQRSSHFDGRVFVGSRTIGTGPAGTASVGFVATGAQNSIANIQLANNEVAAGYNFEEYKPIAISGLVFQDRVRTAGNAGIPDALDATEPRITGVNIRISGTDYAGNVLGGGTAYLEQTTSGTGATNFSFASLPPPNGSGYTLTELQPAGYVNGPIDPPTTGANAPTIANLSGAAAIGAAGTYSQPDLTGNTTYTGIKITGNQVATNYNFPEVRRPSLSGRLYIDLNTNDTYDSGTSPPDTPISGATVILRDAAALGVVLATTTTAANGTYSFSNLNPLLTYVLEEPLPSSPAGLANRTTAVNVGTVNSVTTGTAAANSPSTGTDRITGIDLSAGFDGINYNFGEDRTSSISGTVFLDRDRSGAQNGAEPGISGVSLKLVLGADCTAAAFVSPGLANPVTSAVTTGGYSFSPVPSGYAYTVCETQPAGYADSSGSAVTTSIATGVLPFAGLTGQNFPEMLGSISGLVFNDSGSVTPANTDNGTQQSGETGIGAGVLVTLTGTPSAGPSLPSGGVLVYTDATGAYRFDDLFPGSYTLTETQPAAYVNGTATPVPVLSGSPLVADLGTYSRGALAGNSSYAGINLGIAQIGSAFNFPEVRRPSLSGTVYIDLNTNNSYDGSSTDTPISGATVVLRDAALTQLATTTTDGAGAYSFTLLDPFTTYVLEEPLPVSPTGLLSRATAITVGNAGGTAAANTPSAGTDRITSINLAQGLDAGGYNFGEDRSAAISGVVFNDRNRDGVFAGSDSGISGVTLTLVAGAVCPGTTFVAAGLTNPVTSAVTTGAYSFSPVPVGAQYSVCETQPTGYANGPSGPSTSITIASLAAGGAAGNNFPEVLGDIGGTVFADFGTGVPANNNNGTQQSGEPGVGSATASAGVPVTLSGTPSAGPALPVGGVTVYTDASGNYSFIDLYAGSYTVTQGAVPAALGSYANGINTAGAVSAGGTSGTAGGLGVNSISNLLLNAGSQSPGNNFAKVPVAAIAGTVYIDLNGNTVMDAEPTDGRVSGVTLRLYQGAACSGSVLASTTTGVSGAYIFNGLNPGLSYTVCELQPPAYGDATTNPGAGNTSPAANAITVASLPLAGTSNNNFGESLGSIKGSVYQDFGGPVAANDRNGVRDAGEAGIVNVPMTLTGLDALGAAVNLTQTTDASGNFSFDRLLAPDSAGYTLAEGAIPAASGTYGHGRESAGNASIAAGDATSVIDRISGIRIAGGENATGYNFGEINVSTITGLVYVDRDRNNALDAGDTARIAGVTIKLVQGGSCDAGTVLQSTTTAANGSYSFSGVVIGVNYLVCETQPAGYGNGNAKGVPGSNTITIANLSVSGSSGNDFGEWLGSIAGSVYEDFGTVPAALNNGLRDAGEKGIANVPVTLTGTDQSGVAVNRSATTDASGNYLFDDLREASAGGYTLNQGAIPAASGVYQDGRDSAGNASVAAGDAVSVMDRISAIRIAAGQQATGYNFGKTQGATIAGLVYVDRDRNNALDASDTARIAGVVIRLVQGASCEAGTVLQSTTTAANGSYSFGGVVIGANYLVCETQPSGYGNGNAKGTPGSNVITLTNLAASGSTDNHFGEWLGSIAGSVYEDFGTVAAALNNGLRDAGEKGIANVPVTLTGTDQSGVAVNRSATTDASGNYLFDDLLEASAGGYTLNQGAIPAASGVYQDGRDSVGNASVAAGDAVSVMDRISAIRIAAGQQATGYNFGKTQGATIAGLVYVDRDRNNALDASDTARIAGAVIRLVQGGSCDAGTVLQTTTSAADGTYSFNHVAIGGNYLVCETQPQGYGNGNAKGTPGSNAITLTNLAASGSADNHFGEWLGSIAGYVYQDSNGNGLRDAAEPGITGVGVTLSGVDYSGSVLKRSLVTDGAGYYRFDDLLAAGPAGYAVTEQLAQPYAPGTQISTYNGVTNVGTIAGVPSGSATLVSVLPSAVSAIALPAGGQSVENNFGEMLVLAPDLVVTKTAGKSVFTEGNLAIYTIQVMNQGPAPTVGRYTVVDRLSAATQPAKWSMESAAGSGWTCTIAADKLQLSCDSTQVLAAGQTSPSTIQLSVSIAQGAAALGTLRNSVSVSGGGELPDKAPQASELASPKPCAASPEFNACQTTTGVQISAGLDGHVWIDGGNKLVLDGSDKLLPGWIVEVYDVGATPAAGKSFTELVRGGLPTRTTTTDAQGHYQLCGMEPGSQYRVLFRDPANRIAFPGAVTNEAGRVTGADYWSQVKTVEGFQVLQLTLPSAPAGASSAACNVTATEQSLPLDPNGVVYDSKTRAPLPGAAVSLVPDGACPGYDPKLHIINYETYGKDGAGNPVMTTGSDGFYKFLLSGDPTAPKSCQFRLVVQQPAGYNTGPSTVIPPKPALATPPAPGVYNVQPQKAAPTGAQDTSYYLALRLGLSHQEVFNNHIPLDPTVPGTLVLSKTGDKRLVELGDTVLYTVVVRQTAGDPTPQVSLRDRLPAGFTLVPGTVRLNNVAVANPQGGVGPVLAFKLGTLKTGQDISLSYRVRVGVGAQQGDGINRAQAWGCRVTEGCVAPSTLLPIAAAVASNEARYQVQVAGGVFTTTACLLGKIFVDCNNNHLQDPEELGIPGVRLFLESGASLISDSEGKYSQCGLTPRSHVLKVDATTLPRGSRLTTSSNRNLGDAGSLFIDAKNGELERADFIEGSCSNTVLEQVKARRAQGEVRSNETERAGEPALRFESKPPTAPQQATDGANQPLVQPRWTAPAPVSTQGAEHAR